MTYEWETEGLDADGTSWQASGVIEAEAGRFPNVAIAAIENTFVKVTGGECGIKCPYTITRLEVKLRLLSS